MDNLKGPEAGGGARSHAPEEQQSPIQDRKSFKEPVVDHFEAHEEREGDEDFAAQRSILSGIKSAASGVANYFKGFKVDPRLVQKLVRNREDFSGDPLSFSLGSEDLTVELKAVPFQEREEFVEQIQSMVGNREVIVHDLVYLARNLRQVSTDERPRFIDQIQSLLRNRRATAGDVSELVYRLCEFPTGESRRCIDQIQSLVGNREGAVDNLSSVVLRLRYMSADQRSGFMGQVQRWVRAGDFPPPLPESVLRFINRHGLDPEIIELVQRLVGNREGDVSSLRNLIDWVERRPQFAEHLQTLAGGRDGSVDDMVLLAGEFNRMSVGQRQYFTSWVRGRDGSVRKMLQIADVIGRIPVNERLDFMDRIDILIEKRPGTLERIYQLAQFLNRNQGDFRLNKDALLVLDLEGKSIEQMLIGLRDVIKGRKFEGAI